MRTRRIQHPLPAGTTIDIDHPECGVTTVIVARWDENAEAYRCVFLSAVEAQAHRPLTQSAFLWVEMHEVLAVFGSAPVVPNEPEWSDHSWEHGGSEDTPFMKSLLED